jgi:hypothetical protein
MNEGVEGINNLHRTLLLQLLEPNPERLDRRQYDVMCRDRLELMKYGVLC